VSRLRVGAALSTVLSAALACHGPGSGDESGTESSSSSSSADAGTEVGDELPPAPTLASPADGATEVPIETELCWNQVEDPEGEALRYRVFVDETRLSEGILGDEEGYAGPCVGPLLFAQERSYTWRVEAFEVDDPTRSSPSSETWSFTTVGDGISELVFEDDFESPSEWVVGGDASSGAWTWGVPEPAFDGEASSQPGACAAGQGCWFTGHNPDGVADDADLDGTSSLTSPAFDLGGAATATVMLERFFYKSELGAGPELRVELLVPDPNAPGEDIVVELETLDAASLDEPENLWVPREYAACGAPMADGTRLRLRASDPGAGILEAAVDSVSVHAHDGASPVCELGEGGICDPELGDQACPGELRCCSQGTTNRGVERCTPATNGLDFDAPPASPDDPGNGTLGCGGPDLITDPQSIGPLTFTDIFVSEDTCELYEGCVGATGWRTVMLFTAAIANIGSADLAMGVPANHPELYHYSDCHEHYHFDEFARYELRDANDEIVATGHKQAFCLEDTISWAWPFELGTFDCANQGVSRGFTDVYEAGLPCQWVDVTGVPPGDYSLRISLNQARPGHLLPVLNERDYDNNVLEVPVTIP
jgi:hypothetical protein